MKLCLRMFSLNTKPWYVPNVYACNYTLFSQVDKLVNTFTSELGVTSGQLTDACANSKGLTVEHKVKCYKGHK